MTGFLYFGLIFIFQVQKEPTHQPDNLKLICHCIGCSEVPWVQEGVWMQVSPRGMSSAVPVQTERRDRVHSSFKNVAPQSLWEQIIFQKSKSTFNISNTCMIFVSGFFFLIFFLHVLNISKLRWIWNTCWHGCSVNDPVVVSTGMQILVSPLPMVRRQGSHSAQHAHRTGLFPAGFAVERWI